MTKMALANRRGAKFRVDASRRNYNKYCKVTIMILSSLSAFFSVFTKRRACFCATRKLAAAQQQTKASRCPRSTDTAALLFSFPFSFSGPQRFQHSAEIGKAREERMDLLTRRMAVQEGVSEALQAADQMETDRRMKETSLCKRQERLIRSCLLHREERLIFWASIVHAVVCLHFRRRPAVCCSRHGSARCHG